MYTVYCTLIIYNATNRPLMRDIGNIITWIISSRSIKQDVSISFGKSASCKTLTKWYNTYIISAYKI